MWRPGPGASRPAAGVAALLVLLLMFATNLTNSPDSSQQRWRLPPTRPAGVPTSWVAVAGSQRPVEPVLTGRQDALSSPVQGGPLRPAGTGSDTRAAAAAAAAALCGAAVGLLGAVFGALGAAGRWRGAPGPWAVAPYRGWDDDASLANKEEFIRVNQVPLPNNVIFNNKLKFTRKKPDDEEAALQPPGMEDVPEVIHAVERLPALPPTELTMVKMQVEGLARARAQGAGAPAAEAEPPPPADGRRGTTALAVADRDAPFELPAAGRSAVLRTPTCRVVVHMAASDPTGADTLRYQAEGLERLWPAAPSLHIPRPWDVDTVAGTGTTYLVTEHIPAGRSRRDFQRRLGRGLAQLHLSPTDYPTFGFPTDGYIGAVRQRNNVRQEPVDWVEFWRKYRLGDQLRHLRRTYPNDLPIQKYGGMVMDRLPELFAGIDIQAIRPCLLHGNLEAENIGTDPDGNPFLLQPAAYYGHNEADLGLLRMLGGYSEDFWQAYHQLIPKAGGYSKRIPLYSLNHYLNGYLRAGPEYRGGALELMRKILDSLHVYYD